MEFDINKIIEKEINNEEILLYNSMYNKFDERQILNYIKQDFEYQIKQRGQTYYNNGYVTNCYKNNNEYYATVEGSSSYNVKVKVNENKTIDYHCDCPYEYPCKHIYATLLAISNQEYKTIKLKPTIKQIESNTEEIINNIPAELLKEYILKNNKIINSFKTYSFNSEFRKYLPKQSYEYYYNNLYNEIILYGISNNVFLNYLDTIQEYISCYEFQESFKILKSIIEAYNDTLNLNNNIPLDYILKIEKFLRITYHKCDTNTKTNINSWLKHLIDNNYYNNLYLEDIVINLK